jgi:hypothetical protein
MRGILLLVALGAASQGAVAQDTTVVVHGLVGLPPGSRTWLIGLPGPFRYRDRVIAELALAGDSTKWTSHAGHFVEARGTLDAPAPPPAPAPARATLRVRAMREVDPEGTVRKMVSNSFTHRVAVTLWVLPRTFAWLDSAGRATGVGPVIVYTANNHGESDVTMEFVSKDFVCFSVEPEEGGAVPWRFARQLNTPTDQLQVTLPKFVREVARMPRDAAASPGRYIVRAGFCGFTEYELETQIEVTR